MEFCQDLTNRGPKSVDVADSLQKSESRMPQLHCTTANKAAIQYGNMFLPPGSRFMMGLGGWVRGVQAGMWPCQYLRAVPERYHMPGLVRAWPRPWASHGQNPKNSKRPLPRSKIPKTSQFIRLHLGIPLKQICFDAPIPPKEIQTITCSL